MKEENIDSAMELQLIGHESLRQKPYLDCCGKFWRDCTCEAKGKLTIGVGRNLDDNGITKGEAMGMLRNDIILVKFALEKAVPIFLGLSSRRRMVLVDMCFNMGLPRFLSFKKMLAAIASGDFERAADEMLNSRWARQVGKRAQTLATMMREG